MQKHYDLGTILDGNDVFRLWEEQLSTGVMINGTTGTGKSRLILKVLNEHRRNGRGFLFVDPGDVIDDLLAVVAKEIIQTGDNRVLNKIHLIELSPAQMVRYDMFVPPELKYDHPEVRAIYRRSWQHTKVQSASEAVLRIKGQTEFGVQVRLQRLLANIFTCISTMLKDGHLPVSKALVLLDREHPDHFREYERIKPELEREVVADFETLHAFSRMQDVRQETESTLNTLRAELGPLMKNFLSGTGREPSFSMQDAVARGDYVLVSVKKTQWTSHKQNVALVALLVQDWFEALLNCPREKRRGSTLVIDELHQFLHALPDLPLFQRIIRKYDGGILLGTQDLVSMKCNDIDHAPAILGMVNTVATMRMTWPDDVAIMSRLLFAKNIDFTKLYHEIYQHQGQYDWLRVRETSRQIGVQEQWSEANAEDEDESQQIQKSKSNAEQATWSKAKAKSHGTSAAEMSGWAEMEAIASGKSDSPIIVDGQLKQTLRLTNGSSSVGNTRNGAKTNGTQENETETEAEGGGSTTTLGESESLGRSKRKMKTNSLGGGVSQGFGESEKLLPMPILVHVDQDTGQLKDSVADQYERLGSELTALPRQEGFARVRGGKAFRFRTADVPDAFLSPEAQMKAVRWIKKLLYQTHEYFFTPSVEEAAHGCRAIQDDDERIIVGSDEADDAECAGENPLA